MYFKTTFSGYSKKHFRKKLSKKYKGARWENTEKAIISLLERFENSKNLSRISDIYSCSEFYLGKMRFAIAGTSTGTSGGGRLVFFVDIAKKEIEILLIYEKSDIKGGNETVWFLKEIEENFAEKIFWK